jgi:hypothetical protein
MASRSVRFDVRSPKLSNFGRSSDGLPEIYYLELLCASEGMPLIPAAFAVVSSHQTVLDPRGGLLPVLLMCNP